MNKTNDKTMKTADEVIDATAKHFGVDPASIRQDNGGLVEQNKPRMVAIYLARKYTSNAYGKVGAVFHLPSEKIVRICKMIENELFKKPSKPLVAAVDAILAKLGIDTKSPSVKMLMPEQKIVPATGDWFTTRKIYLDGTNICYMAEKKDDAMSLGNVIAICMDLRRRGADYAVFFDANTRYLLRKNGQIGDAELYERLLSERSDVFREVPGGIQADPFLLMEAASDRPGFRPSVIISNDRFRPFAKQFPFVTDNTRRIPGMLKDGEILFPSVCWRVTRLLTAC